MSERKSENYFRKSVYGPGVLYTVARARYRTDLFCISDSVTLSKSILNENNYFWFLKEPFSQQFLIVFLFFFLE